MTRIFSGKNGSILVLLAVEALIAMSPLLAPGWFDSHDGCLPLEKIFAITHEIRSGDYYPRWLSIACFGKGLPVFNFYSPAFYLITGWLHSLGIPIVIVLRILMFVIFFGGSWGMYLWVRNNCNVSGALIAATIYMFMPYHFLDLYVRGALAEFMALALLPYLFYGIDLSLSENKNFTGTFLVAVSSASIVITHNLSAMMVAPFAFLMFCWRAYTWKPPVGSIIMAALGPILGAGLSAFYWLPVIIETRYLDRFRENLTSWYYHYDNHFVYPSQWFSSFWGFGQSGPGPADGMSFQLGYALLAVMLVAALSFFSPGANRQFGLITLALGLFGLFFTTTFSSLLYELMPVFEYVQFPWRFLGVATLFLAAFTGLSTCSNLAGRYTRLPDFLVGAAMLLCLVFSSNQRTVSSWIPEDLDQMEKIMIGQKTAAILGGVNEYRPKWFPSYAPVDARFDQFIAGTPSTQITNVATKGASMSFSVAKTDDVPITISWLYFPGWQAEVDGVRKSVTPVPKGIHRGFLSIPVPSGAHTVRLRFGSTWPRISGWLIACLTVIVMAVLAGVNPAQRTHTSV